MVLPELSLEEVDYEFRHRYETRVQWIYGCIAVSLLLAVVTVVLRFVARKKRGLKFAWNDYTIVLALVITTGICAVVARATSLGLGLHIVVVGKDKGLEVAKHLIVAMIMFPLAGSTIRFSILMFYVQVFGNSIRWFKIGVRFLAVQWLLVMIIAFLCTAIQCVPLKLAWTSDHAEHCLDIEKFILTLTVYCVFLNFATLFLPLPLIWKLRLNMRKKIGIGALFALAGGDIAINILRATLTYEISPNVIDVTFRQVNNAVLAILELNLGIACACIPTLQPLFNRLASKISSGIDKADIRQQIMTVPFVLMKTRTGNDKKQKSKVKLQRASKILRQSSAFAAPDEEKLIDTQLPPYSQISQPRSAWKGLFRKSGSFAKWPGSRNREELSEKTLLGTQTSTLTWKPETPLQGEIAKNLIQSGYPKAKYASSPRAQQRAQEEPDSVFTLSAQPRRPSRSRSRGLNIDTRDSIVRSDSRDKPATRASPFTGLSSATYLGSPENNNGDPPHPGNEFSVPEEDNDRPSHISRALSNGPSWKRRPSGPTLAPNRYQPSSPSSPAKTPAREKTGKRKGPHYVRSPLTDPDEKIRFGSPREVIISTPNKTPNRGRSLNHKTSNIVEPEPSSEMPKLLEPHYQREMHVNTSDQVSESAMPSPLQVEAKGLGLIIDEEEQREVDQQQQQPRTARDWFAEERRQSADRLPRTYDDELHSHPAPLKVPRERWYVEPTTNSFSWKDPEVSRKREKPLPPLPQQRESDVSLF